MFLKKYPKKHQSRRTHILPESILNIKKYKKEEIIEVQPTNVLKGWKAKTVESQGQGK